MAMFPPSTERTRAGIAVLAVAAIALHLALQYAVPAAGLSNLGHLYSLPLWVALAAGGGPLVIELAGKAARREFGSDLLAGISIVTSVILGEYLAGTLVVLMLSGGQALEAYAVRRASSALAALARRMPTVAHRRAGGTVTDVPVAAVAVGDTVVVMPHEVCPVDGTVLDGHGGMDEAYLTGEPYRVAKAPGAAVLSGAVNGEAALTVRADRPAADSRYAQVMRVMYDAEQRRPRLRRLGDRLGALYTPLAVGLALAAWAVSGDPVRFLAVLVVATPCPLLIAIPVAIIGTVSLAARRGIIIKDPAALERLDACRTAVFDKTGTLTYGRPDLTDIVPVGDFAPDDVLGLVASLERYSKHPLAGAVLDAAAARGLPLRDASEVREPPGAGLTGRVGGRAVQVTGRAKVPAAVLPPAAGGLECVAVIDSRPAAVLRFRDRPRAEGAPFVGHLGSRHHVDRVLLVSGDRESEVRHLAGLVGITEVHAGQTPEQKLSLVRREAARAPTVMFGDGINDAPALAAATVGVAFGTGDVTAAAAGAVVMDGTLRKADELLHLGRRLRMIALQSAVGGMVLSLAGMAAAAAGLLPPVAGAILQEVIDVAAVLNALRTVIPPRALTDY
ncbi:MAG TPA: heavy metal translocating P-type ATPase [Gemmataceae bacterium]|jgi:heavy metal translocating P-type ATPase